MCLGIIPKVIEILSVPIATQNKVIKKIVLFFFCRIRLFDTTCDNICIDLLYADNRMGSVLSLHFIFPKYDMG